MHALVFIAILGIVSLLSVGYLGNDVELWIQSFGVGEGDIISPVIDTDITLRMDSTNGIDYFITHCEFTSLNTDLPIGTKLYCKLYDGPDINTAFIIATGYLELTQLETAGNVISIPITQFPPATTTIDVDLVKNVLVEVQES
jgi:hypothetical protein